MKRIRLGTLMLLVAIAALAMALVVQHNRHERRIAEMTARIREQGLLRELVARAERERLKAATAPRPTPAARDDAGAAR